MPTVLAAIGRFSARHRLLIIGAWLAVFAVFIVISASGADLNGGSTSMPATSSSTALKTVQEKFPSTGGSSSSSGSSSVSNTLQLVIEARGSAKATDPATKAEIESILTKAESLPHVKSASDPYSTTSPYVSKDGTTVVSTLTFEGLTTANAQTVSDRVDSFATAHDQSVRIEVGDELVAPAYSTFGAGEIIGILVAFLVLFITFGSLIAAGANMLVAIVGVGIGTVGVVAWSAFHSLDSTAITLPGMLGLAVGIDYSLFILTRFRAELRAGRKVEDAVARATGTAGTAVVFAGLTVIIALVGLVITRIGSIQDMGFAGAFAVAMAVLISLTLLPVLMKSLGIKALSRKDRKKLLDGRLVETVRTKRTFIGGWGRNVAYRPLPMLLGAVVVLAVIAVPFFSMKTVANIPGGSDPSSTERAAYDLIVDKFGGVQSPLIVLAQGDDMQDHAKAVDAKLTGLDDVESVVPAQIDASGDAALITVIPDGSPIDTSTTDLVRAIRADASSISGVTLSVTGETAIGVDTTALMNQALIEYVAVIVILSFLLMIVMFRSLLVPLFATAGYLLSLGAAFGGLTAVFQWGWLGGIIQAPQGDPLTSLLPIILVGVLFGLAMDYQVFMVSRIREEYVSGLPPKEAIVAGFRKSGPVIIAAALIMGFVFGGFASSTMTFAAETAFGLLVGVLADAFLVRMIIMPALLSLVGRAAWWLPAWLDRLLPSLDTEGHALDAPHDAVENAVLIDA
ncbi:MMPL family transporter [Frondihabitans australicus]|uniref:RND superfamily putative drug exporter n=1 Tax=Frondihabitans australicus TaxID=386892 RepID=A0A495IDU3_9MICO|nr:MMPL family transporter [Frondihabitans australicus]RKR73305.1 RND superfamily putative drug exporter [Frondihabitans australicus]